MSSHSHEPESPPKPPSWWEVDGPPVNEGLEGDEAPAPFPPYVEQLAPRNSSSQSASQSPMNTPLKTLGNYQLLRELGAGGMGVVYEAVETPLNRRVALKVLPVVTGQSKFADRLQHEAQIAARLTHPHIVAVYGSGCIENVPYIAFQLIEGASLDACVRADTVPPWERTLPASPLSSPSRVKPSKWEWLAQTGRDVARALQHAHECGIIHRDIKPSNLLVDADGKIWVTDFGLARAMDLSDLTATGDLLGTLRYMSPEQATGQRGVVDRRSDIYSLGMTLYEVAAGRPGFTCTERAVLLRQILEESPLPIEKFSSTIPRDLATIIGKAIAKLPMDRYLTAGEMADDLQRYLNREPILARPLRPLEKLGRWMDRHRLLLVVVTSLVFMLLTAWNLVSQKYQGELQEKVDELTVARTEAAHREWETLIALSQRGRGELRPSRRADSLKSLRRAAEIAGRITLTSDEQAAFRDEWIASLSIPLDVVPQRSVSYPEYVFSMGGDDLLQKFARVTVARTLVELSEVGALTTEKGGEPVVHGLETDAFAIEPPIFSPGGRYLALALVADLAGNGARIQIWDTTTRERIFDESTAEAFRGVWDQAGLRFLARNRGQEVIVFDTVTRQVHRTHSGTPILGVDWKPGTEWISTAHGNHVMDIQLETGEVRGRTDLSIAIGRFDWHASGRFLIGCSPSNDRLVIWDALKNQQHVAFDMTIVRTLSMPASDLFAVETLEGDSMVIDAIRGQQVMTLPGRPVAINKSGQQLATHTPSELRLWEIVPSDVLLVISVPMHLRTPVFDAAFTEDGRWLAASGAEGVCLINLESGEQVERSHPGCMGIGFRASGGKVSLVTNYNNVALFAGPFDTDSGKLERLERVYPETAFEISQALGIRRVIALGPYWCLGDWDGHMTLVNLDTKQVTPVGQQAFLSIAAPSPDGHWVAAGTTHNQVHLFDVTGQQPPQTLWQVNGNSAPEFSPDGRWLVVSASGAIKVWETETWTEVYSRQRVDASAFWSPATFSPDSRVLVLSENQRDLELLRVGDWQRLALLRTPEPIFSGILRFSPNGDLLARTGVGTVQIWNLKNLRRHLDKVGLDWNVDAKPGDL